MRDIALVVLLVFTAQPRAFAAVPADSCQKLDQLQLRMQVIADNIANAHTTRTPEGGPYQKKKLKCHDGNCEILQMNKVKMVYEPGHPDADASGYVAYPDIDVEQQVARMNKTVEDYSRLASACEK